jgi:hypothetical protein
MKTRTAALTALFMALSVFAGSTYAVDAPVMEWHKGHGTSYGTYVHEGMQTSDGGYIGIGQTNEWDPEPDPCNPPPSDMVIIKTYSDKWSAGCWLLCS